MITTSGSLGYLNSTTQVRVVSDKDLDPHPTKVELTMSCPFPTTYTTFCVVVGDVPRDPCSLHLDYKKLVDDT